MGRDLPFAFRVPPVRRGCHWYPQVSLITKSSEEGSRLSGEEQNPREVSPGVSGGMLPSVFAQSPETTVLRLGQADSGSLALILPRTEQVKTAHYCVWVGKAKRGRLGSAECQWGMAAKPMPSKAIHGWPSSGYLPGLKPDMGKGKGKGKMDEAAAERIRRARGNEDDFVRRATIAAKKNKEAEEPKDDTKGGKGGSGDTKQDQNK
ncbi:hypothetical protein B0H66DRAFT_531471 [Apodospora peruviana]|uniref:Uncharacterized protein n=1 Tax=Apodospora peruviana TaxID=516989 RepID=A0AAE0IBM2_9PEZI|nr:hypothetical protein B0H66DRAFT_531471 [Apodospora peruviana]